MHIAREVMTKVWYRLGVGQVLTNVIRLIQLLNYDKLAIRNNFSWTRQYNEDTIINRKISL